MSYNNCHAKKSHYGSKCNDYDCKECKPSSYDPCHTCKPHEPEFRDDDCCCAQIVAAYIGATATVNSALQEAFARQPDAAPALVANANLGITNALGAANKYLCKKCKLKLDAPAPYVAPA